jgi:hypothetical protein
MSTKTKNWLILGLLISAFILGAPLAQYVLAGINSTEKQPGKTPAELQKPGSQMSPEQAVKMGDQYLRIVPTGEQSFGLQLYDSNFKLIAVNENETTLTFNLPDGEKKTVKITVPVKGCSMEEHSSGGSNCCASSAKAAPHENCEHAQ